LSPENEVANESSGKFGGSRTQMDQSTGRDIMTHNWGWFLAAKKGYISEMVMYENDGLAGRAGSKKYLD
jgi:hypothetical protein